MLLAPQIERQGLKPVSSSLVSSLLAERNGWGEDACDDAATYLHYVVTSTKEGGFGSLRWALESPLKLWITFASSGTYAITRGVNNPIINGTTDAMYRKNGAKVIDGRGKSITITTTSANFFLYHYGAGGLIMTDLYLDGQNASWDADGEGSDAVNIKAGADIFISRCHFRRFTDGLIDIPSWASRSQRITITDCILSECYQALLWVMGDNITLGRSVSDRCRRRIPDIQGGGVQGAGRAHAYNIVYYDWLDNRIVQAIDGGELLFEACMFNPVTSSDVGRVTTSGSGVGKIQTTGHKAWSATTVIANANIDSTFVTNSRAKVTVTNPANDNAWQNLQWEIEGSGPRDVVRSIWNIGTRNGSTTTVSLPSGYSATAGDFCVIFSRVENASGAPATPSLSGFTTLASGATGNMRIATQVKILDGSETTWTIPDGVVDERWICMVFRANKPLTSFTQSTWNSENGGANPATQTITAASAPSSPVLLLGHMAANNPITTRTHSPAMIEVAGSNTEEYAYYYVYAYLTDPVDHTFSMSDVGNQGLSSGYITFS